jgi:hypothetical protein
MDTKFSASLPRLWRMTQTTKSSPNSTKTLPSGKSHPCARCEKTGGFITPLGLLCADHAMAATLSQEKGDDRWMPVPVHQAKSA